MSFSSETKKEMCKAQTTAPVYLQAECYGLLLFAKKFSAGNIIFTTSSQYAANRFVDLVTQHWQVMAEKTSVLTGRHGGSSLFTVTVPDTNDCNKIFTSLGHSVSDISLRINRANLEDDTAVSCFLRGAFLCCGSVIDPVKDYHLEFSVPFKNLCSDLSKLISEVVELAQMPKVLLRKGSYIAYIKDSEQIADLLTFMGAPSAAMEIMQEKIVKGIRNTANRQTNSEVANIKKTVTAAMEQIKAINIIKESKGGLGVLPQELREVALLRMENPDLSLRALGQMLAVPISRSGVNHRIKRIMDMAEDLKKG